MCDPFSHSINSHVSTQVMVLVKKSYVKKLQVSETVSQEDGEKREQWQPE